MIAFHFCVIGFVFDGWVKLSFDTQLFQIDGFDKFKIVSSFFYNSQQHIEVIHIETICNQITSIMWLSMTSSKWALLYGNWNDALVRWCRKQRLLPLSASYTLNTGIYTCFKHSSDDKSKVVRKLTHLPLNTRQSHVTCELGKFVTSKNDYKGGCTEL